MDDDIDGGFSAADPVGLLDLPLRLVPDLDDLAAGWRAGVQDVFWKATTGGVLLTAHLWRVRPEVRRTGVPSLRALLGRRSRLHGGGKLTDTRTDRWSLAVLLLDEARAACALVPRTAPWSDALGTLAVDDLAVAGQEAELHRTYAVEAADDEAVRAALDRGLAASLLALPDPVLIEVAGRWVVVVAPASSRGIDRLPPLATEVAASLPAVPDAMAVPDGLARRVADLLDR